MPWCVVIWGLSTLAGRNTIYLQICELFCLLQGNTYSRVFPSLACDRFFLCMHRLVLSQRLHGIPLVFWISTPSSHPQSQVSGSGTAGGGSHIQGSTHTVTSKQLPQEAWPSPGNGSACPASSAQTCASAHSAAPPASGPGPRRAAARSPPARSCSPQPVQRRGNQLPHW